jgi:hypothetical protein
MTEFRYSAFVSYNHALDGKLAPALQAEIEKFGKPWYRIRSIRLFRDATNLSVAPGLWDRIEHALDDSAYLIVLASPDAASSRWVKKEVAHWLSIRSASTILIALTGGRLAWDDAKSDFDWSETDALPSELRGVFDREPLYVDMRWARDPTLQLSVREPRFAQAILSLSATITGRSMDELGGDAVRNHRIARRWAIGAISTVTTLAVTALTLTYLVLRAEQQAEARNSEALRRESLRLSLAADAETAVGNSTDGASLALAALPSRFDAKSGLLPWSSPNRRPIDRSCLQLLEL